MPAPSPTCPGALSLAGPEPLGPSIICGPLALDREQEDQGRHRGKPLNVVFTSAKDPSVYYGACCGRYTECAIWQAEKRRLELLKQGHELPIGAEPDDGT